MFRWLNGPGSVFKDPLPGSTNYLNAYDSNGFLIRLGNKQKDGGRVEDEFGGSSVLPGEAGAPKASSKNNVDGKDIPRESADDMIPFPLNKEFRSQPVLSEELKDEIFRRITQEGKSVKVVSAELGVEISRVGAVVRLKSVEQNWVEKVCYILLSETLWLSRMRNLLSISLEDMLHGYFKNKLQLSDLRLSYNFILCRGVSGSN
jgi:hypothetical protein